MNKFSIISISAACRILTFFFCLFFSSFSLSHASIHPYLPKHGIVFSSGNTYLAQTDITFSGSGPSFVVSCYYNSQSERTGMFGYGWSGGFRDMSSLQISGNTIIRIMANGRTIFFNSTQADTWSSANGRRNTIAATATGYQLTESNGTINLYDNNGRLLQATRRNGYQLDFSYQNNQLAAITDSFARTVTFSYDNNRVSSLTTPAGTFTYGYDGNDNLVSVTKPDGATVQYIYDDPNNPHNLTGIVNGEDIRTRTIGYDDQDRVTSSSLGEGNQALTIEYPSAMERRITDSQGVTTTYKLEIRNGAARVKSFTGPACSATGEATGSSYAYNDRLQVISITDARGNITSYEYDANGNRTKKTEAVGTPLERETTYTYTTDNQVATITTESVVDPNQQHVISHEYDAYGNLTGRTKSGLDNNGAISRTFSYTYDSLGRISSIDGPRTDVNDVTTFTYYPNETSQGANRGNLQTVTNGLGHITTYSDYPPLGKPQTIVPPHGAAITLSYDPLGRVLTRSRGGLTTSYSYDLAGNLTTINLPEGRAVSFIHTPYGAISSIQDSAGNRISYSYDSRGNRTREEIHDPGGALQFFVEYAYHATGLAAGITRADGSSEELRYDAVGNLVSRINALGKTTSFTFDTLDRLTAMIRPGNVITGKAYDGNDNITSVTDPENRTTGYLHDDFGRRITKTSPDFGQSSFTYDAADNPVSVTDGNNTTVSYSHDALNRLTGTVYPAPVENVVYHYDEDGFTGLLTSVEDATGSTIFRYDDHDRPTEEIRAQDGRTITFRYGYNDNSEIASITYPSGRRIDYVRNTAGRITRVETTFRGRTTVLARDISRKPFGPLSSLTLGNNIVLEYASDQDYRITGIHDSGNLLYDQAWSYLATGRIETVTDHITPSFSQTFGYDDLGRLVSAQGGYGEYAWSLDLVGNRLGQSHGTSQTTYTLVPGSNRLAQRVSGQDVVSYGYDDAGSLISRNATIFTYNTDHRPRSVTENNTVLGEYGYDFRGLRSRRMVNGRTTHFIYNPSGLVLADMDATGHVLHEYAYLDNQPLARFDYQKVRLSVPNESTPSDAGSGGPTTSSPTSANPEVGVLQQVYFLLMLHSRTSTLYFINDPLGTPQMLLDAAGRVVWQGDYHPFGEVDLRVNGLASDLRFPGQRFDAETGLHYNWHRYYDPETGRYISADPIGLQGGINLYAYVSNDPVNYIDPMGLYVGTLTAPLWVMPVPGARVVAGTIIAGSAIYSGYKAWQYWNEAKSNPFKGEPGSEKCTVDADGNPKQKRKYGDDGYPDQDIDYDHDHDQGQPHVHDWTRPGDGGPPTHKDRQPGRPYIP